MSENLMDAPPTPQPLPEPTQPTSETMKLLIIDLGKSRTKENAEHVDKIIMAAERNYFDDMESPRYATPLIDLILIAQQCQLTEIVKNTHAGKYDVKTKQINPEN